MADLVVAGAGAMGLAAAYWAGKAGHRVTVMEAAPEPGGMAAHFDFAGLSIERYYHFCCKTDHPTFELLEELGLPEMRWRPTSMGYFIDGRLHPWGDPISLLRFPGLGPIGKFRYALLAFVSMKRERWDALETEPAHLWIQRWCGQAVYDKLWRPLLELKFYEYAQNVSAAWIWTRVKRIGRSRRSIFQEELGHIEGGTQTLVDGLVRALEAQGNTVRLGEPIRRIESQNGQVTGVTTDKGFTPADAVISTVPTPFVSAMVPGLPEDWKKRYDAIPNIGVVCIMLKLKKPVTPHFWVNVSEPDLPMPGIIELSNLRTTDHAVVYVPYYMPVSHPMWSRPDEPFIRESMDCVRRINPSIAPSDLVATHVGRLRYAQPVCVPGFAAMLPPVQTPIRGLQIADTCFYYPEDRGIAESVRLGKAMAQTLGTAAPRSGITSAAA